MSGHIPSYILNPDSLWYMANSKLYNEFMQKWSVRHGVLSSLGPAALVLIKPPCPTLHCCITSQNTNVRLARSCVMKNINNRLCNRLWYACVEHKLSRWIGYNTRSEIREGSVTMIFWPVGHIGVTWSKWSIQIWPWPSAKLQNFHGQNDQSKSDHADSMFKCSEQWYNRLQT